MKIKEINIEVTKIKEWDKSYDEIKPPKGFRLIKIWELAYILESKYCNKFLGKFKDKWNYFWCEQTKYAKKNKYACRLGRGRCGFWIANWRRFGDSNAVGRVVFVKK
jgi:hypothetical protein